MATQVFGSATAAAVNRVLGQTGTRRVDACTLNGNLLALLLNGNTWTTVHSTDGGTTWGAASAAFSNASATDNYEPYASLFLDSDDVAHVVYRDRSDGLIYYRRGTPNAGRTAWTWGAASSVFTSNPQGRFPDVVAHKDGTDTRVHICYSRVDVNDNENVFYTRLKVTSAGVISTEQAVVAIGGTETKTVAGDRRHPKCSLDFRHNGDGKTLKSGTAAVYVLGIWDSAQSAGFGKIGAIAYTQAAAQSATWNAGTFRTVDPDYSWDSTAYVNPGTSSAIYTDDRKTAQVIYDGTRPVVCTYSRNDPDGLNYARLWDWDDAGSATFTARAVNNSWVIESAGFAHDAAGNIYVGHRYQGNVRYAKWTRATDTWGSPVVVDTGASTANGAVVSTRRGSTGSAGAFLDVLYTKGADSPFALYHHRVTLNRAPTAPTFASGSYTLDRALSGQTISYTFNDPDTGDTQGRKQTRYRLQGDPTWITLTAVDTAVTTMEIPNGLAAGTYEFQQATWDASLTQGPWSSTVFVTMADAPAAPVITDPAADGATVTSTTKTVQWTHANQDAYQWRTVADDAGVANTGTIYDSSATIVDSAARAAAVPFPTNSRTEHVQVRVRKNGLWSTWASRRVVVAWTPPATPTLTIVGEDSGRVLGFAHRLKVVWTDTRTTEPDAVDAELWLREVGDTSDGIRIATTAMEGSAYYYNTPRSGVVYQARAKARTIDGVTAWSAWTSMAAPLALKGAILHDPLDWVGTLRSFRYNEDVASHSLQVEAVLTQYQGRTAPVVEFGDAEQESVEVPLLHSKGRDDINALLALIRRRTILCYRDKNGRKAFGVITELPSEDTFYGATTSLTLAVVDYTEAV